MKGSEPVELLDRYLERYHSAYTSDDVELSDVRGYLHVLPWPESRTTISLHGVGYPKRDKNGQFISPYKLWDKLKTDGF